MKKYTIQEVAKLLADKTHSVYCDVNEFELLRNILKLAFPKDEETDTFEFTKEDLYYGYCRHDSDNWANIGRYLEQLKIINLSDVLKENEMLINDIKVNGYSMFDKFIKTGRIQSQGGESYFDLGSKDSMHVETVTISKEDYDRFLLLENKAKKSDKKFLDKCAIGAMNGFISDREMYMAMMMDRKTSDLSPDEYISNQAHALANAMLTERNKNK